MEPRYIIEETKSGFVVRGRPHWVETESQPQQSHGSGCGAISCPTTRTETTSPTLLIR